MGCCFSKKNPAVDDVQKPVNTAPQQEPVGKATARIEPEIPHTAVVVNPERVTPEQEEQPKERRNIATVGQIVDQEAPGEREPDQKGGGVVAVGSVEDSRIHGGSTLAVDQEVENREEEGESQPNFGKEIQPEEIEEEGQGEKEIETNPQLAADDMREKIRQAAVERQLKAEEERRKAQELEEIERAYREEERRRKEEEERARQEEEAKNLIRQQEQERQKKAILLAEAKKKREREQKMQREAEAQAEIEQKEKERQRREILEATKRRQPEEEEGKAAESERPRPQLEDENDDKGAEEHKPQERDVARHHGKREGRQAGKRADVGNLTADHQPPRTSINLDLAWISC
ncbi:hypothetical protein MD484_g299, partial [Candolleomyces efflorescens]